jgi:HlyD family secretion protein
VAIFVSLLRGACAMKRVIWGVVLAAMAALGWFGWQQKNAPPEISFTRVVRETIVSTLTTNGKVEPSEWASARAEREGAITAVRVEKGQTVAKGAVLVELDSSEAQAELAVAEARIAQGRAQIDVLRGGGRQREITETLNEVARARQDAEIARKEVASLTRLVEKKAATQYELDRAREKVEQAELAARSAEQRKAALVSSSDLTVAGAQLKDAEAAAALAKRRIELGMVRSPLAGTIYQFDVRKGGYVNPGDVVAQIGLLDQVKVTIYVDEPELGRVAKGMPVKITWDALPGKQWAGTVGKTATEIVTLGTRHVGEVACMIANPGHELLPATNVNVEVKSQTVEGAVAIPKEVLRREGSQVGVYLLEGDHIVWRPVKLGVASVTRTQVLEGLKEGDAIALPTERAMKDGMKVKAIY